MSLQMFNSLIDGHKVVLVALNFGSTLAEETYLVLKLVIGVFFFKAVCIKLLKYF